LIYQGLNQIWLQKIVPAGLAGGNFDRHFAPQLNSQRCINFLQGFRRDFFCKIDLRLSHRPNPPFQLFFMGRRLLPANAIFFYCTT
jgi:hypothetical protein